MEEFGGNPGRLSRRMLVVLPSLAQLREKGGVCSAGGRLTRRHLLLLEARDIRGHCHLYAGAGEF